MSRIIEGIEVVISDSARKHYQRDRLTDEDVYYIRENYISIQQEQNKDYPDVPQYLYLGIKPSSLEIEIVGAEFRDGVETIIHASKATKEHISQIWERYYAR